MLNLRAILLWLMMLAVPLQGYAAAAMAFCAPAAAHSGSSTIVVHDHSGHDHSTLDAQHHHSSAGSNDNADRHDAPEAHDEASDASHKCGNCATCHAVGMMPTLNTPILHGLPQADLAEPLRAMATVSPSVPHKPPRA
jgi:cytochrome c553